MLTPWRYRWHYRNAGWSGPQSAPAGLTTEGAPRLLGSRPAPSDAALWDARQFSPDAVRVDADDLDIEFHIGDVQCDGRRDQRTHVTA